MLKLGLLLLLGAQSHAALTVRTVRTPPVPVSGLAVFSKVGTLAGPSLAAPLLAAPSLLPAVPALAPAPQAAAAMAPVPMLAPAAQALACPEPAAIPAALGRVFDGSRAPGFAASGPVSVWGGLSGSWRPENRARLERLIREQGKDSPGYDPERPPVAAFDWDNTMIRKDIGEAVFYRTVREMSFRFDEPGFWDLIPREFGRGELRRSLEAVRALPAAQARRSPDYRRYRELFHEIYERVKKEGPGMGIEYGWLVQLMAGFSKEELERFADETIAEELAAPDGIRPFREMFELVKQLQKAGWDVRVVSATAEWVVARFAARAGIPADHVHGARAATRGGRLTTRLTQKTWGRGKADVLRRRAGRAPLLAAGDSNSDLQMLESSKGESLVVDRGVEPLRSQASGRGWLIQPGFQP
jgi:phosphoserine phosphatase